MFPEHYGSELRCDGRVGYGREGKADGQTPEQSLQMGCTEPPSCERQG